MQWAGAHITSVPKTLVKYLVEYVANVSDKKTADILYDVLDTPVSPELLPPDENGNIAQKTEDNIGPYELHDFFLYNFVRFGFEKNKIKRLALKAFDGKYDERTISKWLTVFTKRFFISQFKRSCIPDSPKVGSVSLSPRGDWRMPSDASTVAFAFASCSSKKYTDKEATIPVTDENGETVTDEQGKVVTEVSTESGKDGNASSTVSASKANASSKASSTKKNENAKANKEDKTTKKASSTKKAEIAKKNETTTDKKETTTKETTTEKPEKREVIVRVQLPNSAARPFAALTLYS